MVLSLAFPTDCYRQYMQYNIRNLRLVGANIQLGASVSYCGFKTSPRLRNCLVPKILCFKSLLNVASSIFFPKGTKKIKDEGGTWTTNFHCVCIHDEFNSTISFLLKWFPLCSSSKELYCMALFIIENWKIVMIQNALYWS